MKLRVFFFAFASVWHSVHGLEHESSFLRGGDVEAVMATDAEPAAPDGDGPFQGRDLRRQLATGATCVTTSVKIVMDVQNKTSEDLLSCDTANGKHYIVRGVPDTVIRANKHGIINDDIELSMPEGAYLDEDTATLVIPNPGKLKFKEKIKKDGDRVKKGLLFDRSRRSLAVTGTHSALVVRVVASGVATSKSVATLSNAVFGNGADGTVDPVTMKGHFKTCSHGQLNIAQATDRNGRSIQIRNGKHERLFLLSTINRITHVLTLPTRAVTVTVSVAATQGNVDAILNAVIAELNSQFGVTHPDSLANLQLYFMPPGVMGGAFAFMPSGISVYDNGWSDASVLMHEVGHNLGMSHSSENGEEYGDESCIMGGGFSEDGPLLCYNSAKSWQMGWYASRNHEYNVADGIWNGRLIGQVDYANGNDITSKVVLKLNTPSSTDYYVMFNRVMSGTTESMNQVMITRTDENDYWENSNLIAKLGSGESVSLPHFYLWESLELTVNNIDLDASPAYADVTIKLGCLYNCGALLETWTGISGSTIADLMIGTNNLDHVQTERLDILVGSLEAPTNVGDNYGSRMSGWLVPPVTGLYEFWIASDDQGEFYLSSDDDPVNKALICKCDWASPRWWDRAPEQKSSPISLVAGQAYYYEVRLYALIHYVPCQL
ncbi:hypothetical protein ACHAW5_002247 [Stephanodiscus triporus]|uniref:PA14 domain-containing protein n=1 Tax=Stephanodiscus triporus TaxID=2934178 RepID=A0ABD3PF88_9STRA